MEFEKNKKNCTITMNQKSNIEEVLKRFYLEECKLVRTSFDANSKLLKLSIQKIGNVQRVIEGVPYKARVGSFMYAMVVTRANVTFAVSTVSQFMSKAGPPHLMAVKHIMRSLKGTSDFKLCLENKDIALKRFCDANWAEHATTSNPPRDRCFLLALESFHENARNNQPLHCL